MSGSEYSIHASTQDDGMFLDVYTNIELPYDVETDFYYTVTREFENRPGALANELYGTPRVAWIFMKYNPDTINDPLTDLKYGVVLKLPERNRLLRIL